MADETPPPNNPVPRAAILLPLALGAVLLGVLLVRWVAEGLLTEGPPVPPAGDPVGVVTLTRDAGGDPYAIDVPWRPGDTVHGATLAAGVVDPAWRSAWRGDGEMAFLTALGGVENQGAAGLNWLFRVNGERADRGAGAIELQANDRVLWEFAPYE